MAMFTEDLICPPELQRFLNYRPEQLGPTPANLRELEQLLYGIWGKKSGKAEIDQKVLAQFQTLCGLDKELVAEHEQRVLRSLDKKQPILVGLDTNIVYEPGRAGVLIVLIMNPTSTLFREVRARFRSSGLLLIDNTQPLPIKLLGSRDALPVYLHYQAPAQSLLTTLALEVDVCDHYGEWRAYNNRSHILLNFPGPGGENKVRIRTTNTSNTWPYYESHPSRGGKATSSKAASTLSDLVPTTNQAAPGSQAVPSWEQMLPIELGLDPERTHRLQAKTLAEKRAATRGTPLTRALLRSQNPAHAPERIELVSRPFIACGRYVKGGGDSISDFSLGFLPGYERISRLHFVICACEEGLVIMHTSRRERSYTAVNGSRLPRGQWQRLESGDILDISGLYDLQVFLAWDVTPGTTAVDEASSERERLGNTVLEIVDLLDQLKKSASTAIRKNLKSCHSNLIRMQNKAAEHNGVNSLGPLLYAHLQRQDSGQRQVVHIYLSKWLSVGSSPQAGLRIDAEDVAPQHAELLFKDGMYWIQNRVDQGGIWVCNHSLASNEAIPLEEGDTIRIGAARLVFERY
jgi:hypothetical protein